ncbi:MAG: hypothetical protein KKA19_00390 [Candidatus Margulisbacteria bacterium]|nr:hypothetical protein [Candidatus Margulisiibacteriota bacterium]
MGQYLLNIGSKENPEYLVQDPSQKNQIVSEAMSYGLILCVILTKLFPHRAQEFDNVFKGLIAGLRYFEGGLLPYWKVVKQGDTYVVPADQKATAADAEIVIAWALLAAQELIKKKKWKELTKNLYTKMAQEILQEIYHKEIKRIPYNWGQRLFLKPSREWGGLKAVNEVVQNPSYLWLDAFKVFIKQDKKNRNIWRKLYKDSVWLFKQIITQKGQIFDWGRVTFLPSGVIEFNALGQGLSFQQTFDGVRALFILGMDKQKKLCRNLLKGKKISEAIITPEKPTKALALASLLALAYGAKDKRKIQEITGSLMEQYNWEEGYFGDRKERYYNNTLIMLLISKIILGA